MERDENLVRRKERKLGEMERDENKNNKCFVVILFHAVISLSGFSIGEMERDENLVKWKEMKTW